ncbi:tetratricopeptide repeat protein [Flavobacterium sp. YO12]|uniref:tetratricopeptide repeat protein n=1 Tax=Flavobacterium sp. YO12 TaxID=1920029 RepID=UPI00100AF629|nr:tetratricopeptide repeat protein [Flavobacterium sp. YO12]RXM47872.1 hypothetical protein BOW55_08760 [Flavobacterium sp. YO12]
MNVTDYTYLMNKPDAITEQQAEALGSVLNEFPYFQSARALRLKGLYNQNSFKYNYALKVTAAHTADRSVLFDFITSENFTTIQGEYYDRKLQDLLEITVVDSEIVAPKPIDKVAFTKIDPIEQSILDSIKEASNVVFEEPAKIIEKPIDPIIEKSILSSIKEAAANTFEEKVKTEEPTTSVSESIIASPSEEEILNTFKEAEKTESTPTETIIESSIISPTEEEILNTFEEVTKSEEKTIEPATEQKAVTPIKGAIPTFFEEIVDDEIEEVRVLSPIEESILSSIKEASTVVFDKVKTEEEPKETESSEPVKNAEKNLEIGKPLDFSDNEKHSFQEWLQLAKTEPIDRTEDTTNNNETKTAEEVERIEEEKKKKAEIIDKFIETNPKISPIKQTAITPAVQFDINKEDNSYLMTETLARVYLEQKKYTKAIQAYEILILKYPEKITFFADRISDIKILQQNNNNN